eukprot:3061563-Prorocentrum_lima.AAC.1
MFNIASAPALEGIKQERNETHYVPSFAYMEDLYHVGPPEILDTAFQVVEKEWATLGLSMHRGKTK